MKYLRNYFTASIAAILALTACGTAQAKDDLELPPQATVAVCTHLTTGAQVWVGVTEYLMWVDMHPSTLMYSCDYIFIRES